MRVQQIDERRLIREENGANFVVFIYKDGGTPQPSWVNTSWAVDSLLFTDVALADVLKWLSEHLPTNSCWSLGVVREPARPTTETHLDVSWIVGSDVLNTSPSDRTLDQQRIADEMLSRRHQVSFP